MQRKTYAVINGEQIKENVKEIIQKYNDYEYYIGVVKNNAYHHGIRCILDMIEGGVNYLAVSSLEEALQIRKYNQEIPILCLEPISIESIDDAINANITLTVESLSYLKNMLKSDLYASLKIHIAIDSGMNRLGFKSKNELNEAISLIKESKKIILEGIYTHFATSGIIDSKWDLQLQTFQKITEDIDLASIPIVHLGRSLTLVNHPKISFTNGIRLGIIMYGFSQSQVLGKGFRSKLRSIKMKYLQKKNHCSTTTLQNDLKLKTVMSLYSEIISIRDVKEGDYVGYNTYRIKEDGYIATIPIGYADGVTKKFEKVYIKGDYCEIISDSMDMIMVYSKKKKKVGDQVEIFGEHIPIRQVCLNNKVNAYHLFNQISNRVTRVHLSKNRKEEIIY
ncbi:MAG: alanine racemase [Bacilli bacterium]|nr:alanine racemase [Bacilli bacterium]